MSAVKKSGISLNLSNGSNDAFKASPLNSNLLNASMSANRRSFSPMLFMNMKTPEISPINKVKGVQGFSGGKENESPSMSFLRRRTSPRSDMEQRRALAFREKRKKRYTMYTLPDTPMNSHTSPSPGTPKPVTPSKSTIAANNSNLEKRMSVHTLLKDLKLLHHEPIFIKEEIDLKVFFTLDEMDLLTIGIAAQEDRKKILNCINSIKKSPKGELS